MTYFIVYFALIICAAVVYGATVYCFAERLDLYVDTVTHDVENFVVYGGILYIAIISYFANQLSIYITT
ncbi:hypothetical protein ACHJH3_11005 [Campylobacter sp. MOP7]|uniref:hypothetical protein n=1 Tax=Campylobacter canis TaxID=3378588 RepID=UPI00387E9C11